MQDRALPARSLGRRALAILSCPILVLLCIAYVDRAAATLAHVDLAGQKRVFDGLTHIVDPIPIAAALGLGASGLAALLGWRPGPAGRAIMAACLATLVAIALKDELKYAFGRPWPETWVDNNPSWIRTAPTASSPSTGAEDTSRSRLATRPSSPRRSPRFGVGCRVGAPSWRSP